MLFEKVSGLFSLYYVYIYLCAKLKRGPGEGGGGPEPLKNSKFNLLNLHKKITKK